MLIKLALAVDPYHKVSFIEYYIRENKDHFDKNEIEKEIKKVFKDGLVFKSGIDIDPVPKLLKWLEDCISQAQF